MPFLETQSQAWDTAFWEFSLVFENLKDDDMWQRADAQLLSVGEIVCHMVYALCEYSQKIEPSSGVESPLARYEARYYLHTLADQVVLGMSVAEVAAELDRVQKAVKAIFMRSPATRETPLEFEGPGRTYGEFADYMVFHVAYHTGQAFSVRHLMGHETNDN